jgi:hypothetical protein
VTEQKEEATEHPLPLDARMRYEQLTNELEAARRARLLFIEGIKVGMRLGPDWLFDLHGKRFIRGRAAEKSPGGDVGQ